MPATDQYFPGVQIVERVFQPGQVTGSPVSTLGAFVGRSHQGPIVPTIVNSWPEFQRLFGTDYTDLHNAVSDFYANGGRSCAVVRIAGANAVAAKKDVYDDTVVGTPSGQTPLFTATALNPGIWGNELKLVTGVIDTVNKRFDVSLFRVPAGATDFDPVKRNSQYLIDQWLDVSLDPNADRYLYTVANKPSLAGSPYVSFAGQSYNPATPATRPLPGPAGGNDFTGGTNGIYTNPYDPAASYSAAVASLSEIDQPIVLNMPNMTDGPIVKSAVQAAAAQANMFVVVDTPVAQTPANAVAYAQTTLGLGTLGVAAPSYAAVYYPWIYMPAVGSVGGRQALHPPGGGVVGVMVSTDITYGAWRTPAGSNFSLAGASDSERKLTDAELTTLNNAHVNAIKGIVATGAFAVMGGRTLKKSGKDKYIANRRTIIEIAANLKQLTEFAIFEPNDSRLWRRLHGVVSPYLAGFWQSGGLRGATAAEAYYVLVDETINTPNVIDQGTVMVEVGVALTTPAEFVVITIGQFEGGAAVQSSV